VKIQPSTSTRALGAVAVCLAISWEIWLYRGYGSFFGILPFESLANAFGELNRLTLTLLFFTGHLVLSVGGIFLLSQQREDGKTPLAMLILLWGFLLNIVFTLILFSGEVNIRAPQASMIVPFLALFLGWCMEMDSKLFVREEAGRSVSKGERKGKKK